MVISGSSPLRLSIVVPTFNESLNVRELLHRIGAALYSRKVLHVLDACFA